MEVAKIPVRKRHGLHRTLEVLFVVSLIALTASISITYALIVPPFMVPDEIAHADYAFAFLDAGGPFRLQQGRPGNYVARQTRYLVDAFAYRKLRYNAFATARVDFASPGTREKIDRAAPLPSGHPPREGAEIPYAMIIYPSPYYVLTYFAMSLTYAASSHSLIAAFFAARFLNVAFLTITLCIIYLILIETGFKRTQRLLLFTSIALFPMTQWISASIQPDNQSALFMSLGVLFALRIRKSQGLLPNILFQVAATCALAMTKVHYATIMIATTLANYVPAKCHDRQFLRNVLASALVPTTVVLLVPSYLCSGNFRGSIAESVYHSKTITEELTLLVGNFTGAVSDAYLGGTTFDSFWLHVGIRSAKAYGHTEIVFNTLKFALVSGTLLTIVATIRRQVLIILRLIHIRRKTGRLRLLSLVKGDIHLKVYLILSFLLFSLSASTNGYLQLQGRYWYPILTSTFVTAVFSFASLGKRSNRSTLTTSACAVLALMSLILSPAALASMYSDFHAVRPDRPVKEIGEITISSIDGKLIGSRPVRIINSVSMIRFRGVALDSSRGSPLDVIRARLDGRNVGPVLAGLTNPILVKLFNDPRLGRCGFALDLRAKGLSAGFHRITFFAVESKPRGVLPIASQEFSTSR